MAATLLTNRALIRLSTQDDAEDVRDFLQGLITNDVSAQALGDDPVYAALLTPQGKTLFDFLLWADGDDVLLDCETELAPELIKRLSLYRLRRKITIAIDESLAVHWSPDRAAGEPDPRMSALGHRWLAPEADAEPADGAWLAHRLSLGVPETRSELGDILWLETNAIELNGVAFEKGCYIGQENTARMNWRSKVNRRLVVVPLDQSDEKRRKAAYPELGLAVDHLRVSDLNPASLPGWQAAAITKSE
ncbi:YgfZ/GcvT domain-containing protein [Qipengyuania sp. DGS5-3]|uniref:CAF17-like 4Fe-4S cluster assembly/insertion protein YgfZ n=1 Tax=Qipengyuania sp. DGS5-3 TaxID=3349632 RepID=UPI0036D3B806